MRAFTGFTKRNLLIYFKDRQSVLFSLLTSIIVFVLYLLFLKGTFLDAVTGSMRGLENIVSSGNIDMLVNGILLTGIMGSATITVPYNCLTTVVRDREFKIDYDISSTPLKRWQIILSYFVAAVISAFIMTSLIMTIGLVVLSSMGNMALSAAGIIKLYGMVAFGAVSSTSFFMLLVMFFKTTAASGAFFGMLSAAAGFVIGAYIPVSAFSDGVQTVCNIFPASHVTTLFRGLILNGVLENINGEINGLDGGMFVNAMKDSFSFNASMFGSKVANSTSLIYIGIFAVVTIIAMIFVYGRTYKRK